MSSVMEYLQQLNAELQAAEVQEPSSDFPDGNYVVRVEKADIVPVKNGENAGKPQVEWWLRVLEGPAGTQNRIIFHYHRLYGRDAEQQRMALSRFKTDLARIGESIDSFDVLPALLANLIAAGVRIRVTLKTNPAVGIQNCYFNGLAK